MAIPFGNLPIPDPLGLAYQSSPEYLDARKNVILSESGLEGIAGFEFDIPTSEKVEYTADITDHYGEDNTPFQDHRTIKPVQITLTGYVGEVIFEGSKGLSGQIGGLTNRLSAIPAFTAGQTDQSFQEAQEALLQFQADVALLESIGETAIAVGKGFQSLLGPEPNKQQVAFNKLKALFYSNKLLTVQTPWNFYENLMISSVSFSQDENSAQSSDIKVTLKEVRLVKINSYYTVLLDPLEFTSSRHDTQVQPQQEVGNVNGEKVELESLGYAATYGRDS